MAYSRKDSFRNQIIQIIDETTLAQAHVLELARGGQVLKVPRRVGCSQCVES